jgi:hypothetical protein
VAHDYSHVVVRDSAYVEAHGSPHSVAHDSSRVEARGSSHVEAHGSSHVVAWDFSSVVQIAANATINCGPSAHHAILKYPADLKDWIKMKGIEENCGSINLFKAVRLDGMDFHTGTISYLGEAVAPDWDPAYEGECGYGLHLADSPSGASQFVPAGQHYRILEVSARTEDCRCFPGLPRYPMKLRARACRFVGEVARGWKA